MSQPVVVPELSGGGESASGEAPLTPRSRASFKDLRRLNSMSSPKAVSPVAATTRAAAPVAATSPAAVPAPDAAAAPAPVAAAAPAAETDKPTVAIMEPTPAAAASPAPVAASAVQPAAAAAPAAHKPAAAAAAAAASAPAPVAKTPEEEASWLSQATWWWMTPLLQLGTERPYVWNSSEEILQIPSLVEALVLTLISPAPPPSHALNS